MRNPAIAAISAVAILAMPIAQGKALTLRPIETLTSVSYNLAEIRHNNVRRGHQGNGGNHHSGYRSHGNWIWAIPAIGLGLSVLANPNNYPRPYYVHPYYNQPVYNQPHYNRPYYNRPRYNQYRYYQRCTPTSVNCSER